ncbi:MAG: hypothetical protein DK304_000390 [Chloroflexi bacterium]|jgi:hypothetical protein|nr:MAG: hypothetical protein DK304_000390 [Chloroflexota bacterium]
MPYGLTIKHDRSGKRLEVQCAHQNGLIYVVPSDASWVCDEEHIHAHALAGFLGDLSNLDYPKIEELMQKWGLYFRKKPLEED